MKIWSRWYVKNVFTCTVGAKFTWWHLPFLFLFSHPSKAENARTLISSLSKCSKYLCTQNSKIKPKMLWYVLDNAWWPSLVSYKRSYKKTHTHTHTHTHTYIATDHTKSVVLLTCKKRNGEKLRCASVGQTQSAEMTGLQSISGLVSFNLVNNYCHLPDSPSFLWSSCFSYK